MAQTKKVAEAEDLVLESSKILQNDFASIFEYSPIATLIVERKTDEILWVNQKFCSMFFTTSDEILYTKSIELIDYSKLKEYYKIVGKRSRNPYDTYVIELKFNKASFWGEVRVQNHNDFQIATIINVTERVNAVKNLRETYQKIEEIQHNFLPKTNLNFPKLKFDYFYKALSYSSGDMFTVFPQNEICGITIADMSGHDLTASFLMSKFITFIRTSQDFRNLKEVIKNANEFLLRISDSDDYSTIFIASFSPEEMTLRYLNAGHPNQLLVRKDKTFELLKASLPLIGTFKGNIFNPILEQEKIEEVKVSSGDKIILFTDFFLAPESSDEGVLLKMCLENSHLNCTELKDYILQKWFEKSSAKEIDDDATLLILEIQ